jgi:hypothetical protein
MTEQDNHPETIDPDDIFDFDTFDFKYQTLKYRVSLHRMIETKHKWFRDLILWITPKLGILPRGEGFIFENCTTTGCCISIATHRECESEDKSFH